MYILLYFILCHGGYPHRLPDGKHATPHVSSASSHSLGLVSSDGAREDKGEDVFLNEHNGHRVMQEDSESLSQVRQAGDGDEDPAESAAPEKTFDEVDTNGDGSISRKEFEAGGAGDADEGNEGDNVPPEGEVPCNSGSSTGKHSEDQDDHAPLPDIEGYDIKSVVVDGIKSPIHIYLANKIKRNPEDEKDELVILKVVNNATLEKVPDAIKNLQEECAAAQRITSFNVKGFYAAIGKDHIMKCNKQALGEKDATKFTELEYAGDDVMEFVNIMWKLTEDERAAESASADAPAGATNEESSASGAEEASSSDAGGASEASLVQVEREEEEPSAYFRHSIAEQVGEQMLYASALLTHMSMFHGDITTKNIKCAANSDGEPVCKLIDFEKMANITGAETKKDLDAIGNVVYEIACAKPAESISNAGLTDFTIEAFKKMSCPDKNPRKFGKRLLEIFNLTFIQSDVIDSQATAEQMLKEAIAPDDSIDLPGFKDLNLHITRRFYSEYIGYTNLCNGEDDFKVIVYKMIRFVSPKHVQIKQSECGFAEQIATDYADDPRLVHFSKCIKNTLKVQDDDRYTAFEYWGGKVLQVAMNVSARKRFAEVVAKQMMELELLLIDANSVLANVEPQNVRCGEDGSGEMLCKVFDYSKAGQEAPQGVTFKEDVYNFGLVVAQTACERYSPQLDDLHNRQVKEEYIMGSSGNGSAKVFGSQCDGESLTPILKKFFKLAFVDARDWNAMEDAKEAIQEALNTFFKDIGQIEIDGYVHMTKLASKNDYTIFSAVTESTKDDEEPEEVIIKALKPVQQHAEKAGAKLQAECNVAKKLNEAYAKEYKDKESHFMNCLAEDFKEDSKNKYTVLEKVGQKVLKYANETAGQITKLRQNLAEAVGYQLLNSIVVLAKNDMSHGDVSPSNVFCKDHFRKGQDISLDKKHHHVSCKLIDFNSIKTGAPDFQKDIEGVGATVFAVACDMKDAKLPEAIPEEEAEQEGEDGEPKEGKHPECEDGTQVSKWVHGIIKLAQETYSTKDAMTKAVDDFFEGKQPGNASDGTKGEEKVDVTKIAEEIKKTEAELKQLRKKLHGQDMNTLKMKKGLVGKLSDSSETTEGAAPAAEGTAPAAEGAAPAAEGTAPAAPAAPAEGATA
eukprot:TRINITY_DN17776_c0_g1_i1.p1 TRINITY_DN17776_c0_g1~~TRINITY_DN17776_c0_g1_i1.p1  ORF type:complete len:1137 (+),score=219.31 TRINITY_DN17776_c0_g1_i1:43-3453(+)